MGLFLDFSAVAGAASDVVEKALDQYAADHAGTLVPASVTANDLDIVAIAEAPDAKVSVLHRGSYLKWHEVSAYLSKSLKAPAFFFQIHDGDIWIYQLFLEGIEADAFNPVPDYWGRVSGDERKRWSGNPKTISRHWPGVMPADLQGYLKPWDEAGHEKAYLDDVYPANDIWQISDFMRKLGLTCPVDEQGNVSGKSFRLRIPVSDTL